MEMISVPSIMAIVYALIMLLKLAFKKYTAFTNFVPIVAGLLGAILGIVAFYAVPVIMPTDNLFHAILFGLFSGLSSVGSESLVLQLKQFTTAKKQNNTASDLQNVVSQETNSQITFPQVDDPKITDVKNETITPENTPSIPSETTSQTQSEESKQ